jgi:hypothetical protein
VGLVYVGIFALFFWGIHGGVGQFWDWSFPYFSDHLSQLFANKSTSWTAANQGSALGYSSDYFVRFFVALFGFLPPEVVRYALLVLVFAAGAYGMFMIAKRHTTLLTAFLIGLVTLVNPAIFYKYTAGHFNYLVAFALFIYLLYFLFYHYQPRLRSAVIVGLFFALMGAQIQFFVIAAFFLVIYFAFNRDQLRPWHVVVMLGLPILINLVWLANFISGAASAGDIGAAAAKVSFKSLSGSDFLSIFTFSFAKATLLSKFYALYELLWNAALFILLLWLLVREKRKQRFDSMLLVFLAVMIFMATGLFQMIHLGPISMLYPMLREVGHFAPIIVLTVLLLLARLVQTSRWRWAVTAVLAGSLLIVGVKFQYFSQAYSFADVRAQFAPFKQFADEQKGQYRILSYPFFDQYSFNRLAKDPAGTMPLKNSGHDSFAAFSNQAYINNAVAPYRFQDSLQYQLLQTYNVDVLRPYNIKYIFDFTDIYESNYEKYVPPTVYNNDLELIKNDKAFFDKLLAANPGKLKRINNNVLEVTNTQPRVSVTTTLYRLQNPQQAMTARDFTDKALGEPLNYTTDADSRENRLQSRTTDLTPLFGEGSDTKVDAKNNTSTQTVRAAKNSQTSLYINREHDTVFYKTTATAATIYTQSTGTLSLNGRALYDTGSSGQRILQEFSLRPDATYYAAFKGKTIKLQPNSSGRLGLGERGDTVEIYTAASDNLIQNGSFEQNLWQDKVADCNNYDFEKSARLGMSRTTETASAGAAALQLESEHHDACTYTTFKVAADSRYLLTFDYQSPNAKTASFYMAYDNDSKAFARASQTVRDTSWDTYNTLITTPNRSGTARLYLYALEQRGQKTINRYDAVHLTQLSKVQDVRIPGAAEAFEKIDLPAATTQRFSIADTNQSYRNLLANPSFEQGSWQKEVSDCRDYDANADIGMRINTADHTDGKQSLELRATRHDACVRSTTDISAQTDYQLSFDVKGQKGKNYAYAVSFDDPENTIRRQQQTITATGTWQTATFRIKTPVRASTITVYLYAPEASDKTTNTLQYDNVALTELPDFVDRFFILNQPRSDLTAPKKLTYRKGKANQQHITIAGAAGPFYMNLSETYHPRWRLELANNQVTGPINSWLPGASGTVVNTHLQTNNYNNTWLVDPAAICQAGQTIRAGCTKADDGSYTIELVAEFVPQRLFGIAASISWLTLIGSLGYVVWSRHHTEAPRYRNLHSMFARRKR